MHEHLSSLKLLAELPGVFLAPSAPLLCLSRRLLGRGKSSEHSFPLLGGLEQVEMVPADRSAFGGSDDDEAVPAVLPVASEDSLPVLLVFSASGSVTLFGRFLTPEPHSSSLCSSRIEMRAL